MSNKVKTLLTYSNEDAIIKTVKRADYKEPTIKRGVKKMAKVAYIRCSTQHQRTDRQEIQMPNDIDKNFVEKELTYNPEEKSMRDRIFEAAERRRAAASAEQTTATATVSSEA